MVVVLRTWAAWAGEKGRMVCSPAELVVAKYWPEGRPVGGMVKAVVVEAARARVARERRETILVKMEELVMVRWVN